MTFKSCGHGALRIADIQGVHPMRNRMRLQDKVALVTGASQGLGQHLSLELAAQGAKVVLAARNEARLNAIRDQITAAGGAALVVPTDVADEAQCDRMIERTLATFGFSSD